MIQRAAWARPGRDRGGLQLIKGELVKINRDRLQRCVANRLTEFADRKKAKEAPAGRPAYNRNFPRKRPKSRDRPGSSRKAPERRAYA